MHDGAVHHVGQWGGEIRAEYFGIKEHFWAQKPLIAYVTCP